MNRYRILLLAAALLLIGCAGPPAAGKTVVSPAAATPTGAAAPTALAASPVPSATKAAATATAVVAEPSHTPAPTTAPSPTVLATAPSAPAAGRTRVSSVVSGQRVIFLAGRDDVAIPALDAEAPDYPILRFDYDPNAGLQPDLHPVQVTVQGGDEVTVAAMGGMNYHGGEEPEADPDGIPDYASEITGVAGISGYKGPAGALVGVFLGAENPAVASAPEVLDFGPDGLGSGFGQLQPGLGQVFFIGDGNVGRGSGAEQRFVAPKGSTRLFLGIADAAALGGVPGLYGDNVGSYTVTLSLPAREVLTSTVSIAAGQGVVSGTAVIYLAGRDDMAIPPVGEEFPLLGRNCVGGSCVGSLLEVKPLLVAVQAGEALTLTAMGAVDYYGNEQAAIGPDGEEGTASEIESLDGISGYRGPNGALVGVFLGPENPADLAAPEALDFSPDGLGVAFEGVSPALGQVFFVGDGLTGSGQGRRQSFTVPAGATRLYLGIADANSFAGPPGAYDDNVGAFIVTVGRASTPR